MNTKNYVLAFMALVLSATGVFAQGEKFPSAQKFNTWSVGLNFGPTIAHTDISASDLGDAKYGFAFGATVAKAFTHTFALQGNLNMGGLKGENGAAKNYAFDTKIKMQYSLNGVFTFGNISYLNRSLSKLNYFASIGLGHISFEPNSTLNGVAVPEAGGAHLAGTTNNSYAKTTELIMPVGIGAKYSLGKNLSAKAEYVYNMAFTDKLDDRSVGLSNNDSYSYINLGVNYTFGKKDKALEWVNPLEQLYTEMSSIRSKMDSLVGDMDKDGVADLYDKDNATPPGTKVFGDGTSVDTDGDGVADASDAEVFSSKGARVDVTGKEIDTDGDGVADSRDLEPATEKGKLVNFQGITIKVSGDAASTGYDKYMPLVFFDFNKSNVKTDYHEGLAALARIMTANPSAKVSLYGNCDVVGTEAANKKLGQTRAEVVRDYMVNVYGIDASRFECVSKGNSEPFANKGNRKDKDPLNRRVDYKIN